MHSNYPPLAALLVLLLSTFACGQVKLEDGDDFIRAPRIVRKRQDSSSPSNLTSSAPSPYQVCVNDGFLVSTISTNIIPFCSCFLSIPAATVTAGTVTARTHVSPAVFHPEDPLTYHQHNNCNGQYVQHGLFGGYDPSSHCYKHYYFHRTVQANSSTHSSPAVAASRGSCFDKRPTVRKLLDIECFLQCMFLPKHSHSDHHNWRHNSCGMILKSL